MPRRARLLVPTEVDPVEPTGTVICEGTVPGRAVAWKAPAITKNGKAILWESGSNKRLNSKVRSYKAFVAWITEVQLRVRCQYRRRRPYAGPVELWATFYMRPMSNDRINPDLCNVVKAFEDALQGVVIVNDSQVQRHRTDRVMTAKEPERVEYSVRAL